MKKTVLFILSVLLGIALFIAVLSYIGIDDVRGVLSTFSWPVILLVAGLGFIQTSILVYRWFVILKAQHDKVRLRDLFGPKFVGLTVSYLTPGLYVGGEPVRAYLLKRNSKVPLSHGFASIIVDKILDFTYPLPFLIGALIYAIFKYDISWGAVMAFIIVLLGLISLLILFYVQTYRGKGFFSALIRILRLNKFKKMQKAIEKMLYFEELIIQFFNHRKDLFIKGLLLSLLAGGVIFLQFVIILNALGIEADIIQILVMMVFMILSFLMPIPASIGSFEASQSIVFTALGHPASVGVAFTLLIRVAELFKLAVGFIFLSRIGLDFIRRIAKQQNGNGDFDAEPETSNIAE